MWRMSSTFALDVTVILQQVAIVWSIYWPCVVGDGNPLFQCLLETRPTPMTRRECIDFDAERFVERPNVPPSVAHKFTCSGFSRALNHFVHKDGGDRSTHLTVGWVRRLGTRFEGEKEHGIRDIGGAARLVFSQIQFYL